MRATLLLSTLLMLSASSALAQGGSQLDEQWARTEIPYQLFYGTDFDAVPEIVTSTKTGSAVRVLWQLPAQARVQCFPSGGSHYYACWSQDPSPNITASAFFNDDSDGVYTKGNGPCMFAQSGTPYLVTGSVPAVFRPRGVSASWPPGSRKGTCLTTGEPCAANAECTTGTCSYTQLPSTAYLFVGCADGDNNCPCTIEDVR